MYAGRRQWCRRKWCVSTGLEYVERVISVVVIIFIIIFISIIRRLCRGFCRGFASGFGLGFLGLRFDFFKLDLDLGWLVFFCYVGALFGRALQGLNDRIPLCGDVEERGSSAVRFDNRAQA